MNAPFFHASHANEFEFPILAFAWRGACLELYSGVEHAISATVALLAADGKISVADSNHVAACVRLRAILRALGDGQFDGHERRTIELLEEWRQLEDHRIYLAHGTTSNDADGISFSIEPRTIGGRLPDARRSYCKFAMLALITELHATSRRLRQQLGQINAVCRRRSATALRPNV